jgi:hypothetical protein
MTCEEVKALLGDYLDRTLDTATTTRVATHLISCAPCGAEANDLTDCIDQIACLPALEPPLGFAQRVMAHVHEIEPKPAFWQRLFAASYHWTKAIPLPATALVAVGVLGLFLYQKDDALKVGRFTASTTPTTTMAPTDELKQETLPASSAPIETKEKQAAQSMSKAAAENPPTKTAAAAHSRDQVSAAKSAPEPAPEENRIAKRPPLPVQEASSPSEAGRFSGGTGFAPAMSVGGLRPAAPRAPTLTLERAIPLGERIADYEFIVRRHPPQRRESIGAVSGDLAPKSTDEDPARRQAGSAPIRIESIAEIRFYHVAPEHFEFFKKELASEAIIESESKPAAKESEAARFDRQLLVKVTILPAAAPDSAAPSR